MPAFIHDIDAPRVYFLLACCARFHPGLPGKMASLDKTIHTRHAEIALRETSGKGMPVLLIHGSGSSKDVFAKQMESPLADIYRMIAIDLPGHGASSNPADAAATYTVTGLADVVEDVLTELGIG